MRDIIIDLQNSDAWEIQLTIAINFISSKGREEEHVMHSSSGNITFAPYSDADDVIYELFRNIKVRKWLFDSVQLMYDKCNRVNLIRGGSYIDSPDWIKKSKNKSKKYRQ